MRRRLVLAVLLGAWPVLWYARVHQLESLARAAIPVFVLLVFASVVAWGSTRLVRVAFGCVAVGDLYLNLTPWPAVAVPAFGCAHLCLAGVFLREKGLSARDVPVLAAPLVVAALFWSRERPLLSGAARSLVAAYLVLLCGMWWRALCSLRRGAAVRVAGATLFFATDLFAIAMKVEQTGAYVPWIWALYPPALIGLAWSFWAEA